MPESIDVGSVRLERLRPGLTSSFAAAFRASEREVRAWMPSAAREQENPDAFVSMCAHAFDEGTAFAYAVVEGGDVVGYCSLTPHEAVAEVGYWIRSDRAGAGLATRVVRTVVATAFDVLPAVQRVHAHCDEANSASRRVAERAGLQLSEAVRRPPRTTSETDVELVLAIERPRALHVRRIRPDEADLYKRVRLAALQATPSAFGSTYANESRLTSFEWAERARLGASSADRAIFLAFIGEEAVGLAGGWREQPDSDEADLISMWVAPDARRRHVGRTLVQAAIDWARTAGATTARLWVTRGNDSAYALYEAMGFRVTGEFQPLPSDPCKDEVRMSRRI